MQDVSIVKIDKCNYHLFLNMVYWRIKGIEKTDHDWDDEIIRNGYKTLAKDSIIVYAAEEEGKFVGWISLLVLPKIGLGKRGYIFVDELWVQPSYRKKGIGGKLLEKCDLHVMDEELDGCRLVVSTENRQAHSLYQALGFKSLDQAYFMEKVIDYV